MDALLVGFDVASRWNLESLFEEGHVRHLGSVFEVDADDPVTTDDPTVEDRLAGLGSIE